MKIGKDKLIAGMVVLAILDSMFVYIQAYTNFSTKSACDVSLSAFVVLLFTSMAWVAWGWYIQDIPTATAGLLTAIGSLAVVTGIFMYGGGDK